MKLKRRFVDSAAKHPKVSHVDVLQHGPEWRPSTRIIARGQAEGWLARDGDKITITTGPKDPDLIYKIVVLPGTYCCHCGEAAGNSKAALAHVKKEHKGKKSPSANHPAGYAVHHFYMCELERANG